LPQVTKRAAWPRRPGVIPAMLLGIMYSSSSLDKSNGPQQDCPNPEDFAEGKRLLAGTLLG